MCVCVITYARGRVIAIDLRHEREGIDDILVAIPVRTNGISHDVVGRCVDCCGEVGHGHGGGDVVDRVNCNPWVNHKGLRGGTNGPIPGVLLPIVVVVVVVVVVVYEEMTRVVMDDDNATETIHGDD